MVSTGDRVWCPPASGVEDHPAIVIRVSDDRARVLVLTGTGTPGRDMRHVVMDPADPACAAAKLTKKTYFYYRNVRVCAAEALRANVPPARFPRSKWNEVRALALEGCREQLPAAQVNEWWPAAPGG
jgi:hypothetical protein